MSGINDFAFKMATVNGTGSASANSLLMQAIFRMGIPVTGKNLFPSNIQGLPTFYEIRVSAAGYTARPSEVDLVVALNPATYAKDVASVREGGYLLYDSSWPLEPELVREGIAILGIPFGKLCVEHFQGDRNRTLLRNIVYAGALAAFLEMDMDIMRQMLVEKFSKKKALLDANNTAIRLGYDYARTHFECPLPFHLEKMDATGDSIIIDGNTAAALGALYAGATVGAWYPITPSTSLMEAFTGFCKKFRTEKDTGLAKYCIIQAEDELSAAGIAIGAGWAGARAFTNTSGPGISLMQEFIGLAYYTEIPAVFFDIQRTGPSTGMPTRTQQADLLSMAYASHGDTKHIMLFPSNPEECFYMSTTAFDLADRFQTPVFVASDLDIGMNDWMCKRLKWDDSYTPDRGKCLSATDLESIKKFSRYLDAEGDGIAARSLPGVHANGAYFVRGSGHDKHGVYTEDSDSYQEVVDRLKRKLVLAGTKVPQPVVVKQILPLRFAQGQDDRARPERSEGHSPLGESRPERSEGHAPLGESRPERSEGHAPAVGITSIGGCDAAIREALDMLAAAGVEADYMRIRAFPFSDAVRDFLDAHEVNFVVEQNRDAQLRSLIAIETGKPRDEMIPVLDYGGMPLTARAVVRAVLERVQARPVADPTLVA